MISFGGLRSAKELPVKELSIFRSSVMFKLFQSRTIRGPSVSVSYKFSENLSFRSKVEMVIQRHTDVVINLVNFPPLRMENWSTTYRDLCHCRTLL